MFQAGSSVKKSSERDQDVDSPCWLKTIEPRGSPEIPLEEPAETLLRTGVDDAPCFEGSLCLG